MMQSTQLKVQVEGVGTKAQKPKNCLSRLARWTDRVSPILDVLPVGRFLLRSPVSLSLMHRGPVSCELTFRDAANSGT